MKKVSNSIFVSIVLLGLSTLGYSQSTKTLFKEGHKLYKKEHYRNALPFLEKVVEAEPNNAEAVFEAGVCYLHRYSKEKGLEYILKSYALDSNASKYIHYWMGRAYHQNYQFDKAIEQYNIYKSSLKKTDQRRKDTDKNINQTNTARQMIKNPEDVRVFNLGPKVNTIFSEHSPITSSNDSLLMFTSRRKRDDKGKEDLDGEYFEDILQTRKQANGEWSTPEHILLNTTGHDASIQLLDNDNTLLLYREAKGGDIFITERDPGSHAWKDPEKFADINTPDFEADAFITTDGKTAYFSTNHYKKVGDLDIYYITKEDDGKWSKPKELYGDVNTSEDDDAPFVTRDGKTLYFCSRGHTNMGGYDVFKSTLDTVKGEWSKPVNLGYPINTPDDDVYYYLSASGKKAYLASYREGGYGEKDIYEVTPIAKVIINCKLNSCTAKRDNYTISMKSLLKNTRPVAVSGKIENNQYNATVTSFNTYRLAVFTSKDTVYAETFEIPFIEEENQTIEKTIFIPCPEGPKEKAPVVTSLKYVFRDIYFERGTLELTPHSKSELEIATEILRKNPTAQVKIKGSSLREENKALAAQRAKIVYDQLKAKGISNITLDSVSETNGTGIGGRSAKFEIKVTGPLATNFDPRLIPQSALGSSFVLRSVFFETGKAELKEEGKAELDIIYNVLTDYPDMEIEIAGHTDSKGEGTGHNNQELSEERAHAAMVYLISKGISKDRVTSKGYGPSQPIADNDTEEGRRLNRRTEIRILKR